MKRSLTITLLSLGFVGSLLFISPQVHAESSISSSHPSFFQGFIAFIAQKFGLDKTQVQSAADEYKTQHKQMMGLRPTLSPDQQAARDKTRLDQLVKDGKITQAQEQAILSELTTLRSKYSFDSLKNLTPEERRTKMQQLQDEIVAFAKSQGIDSSYVMPFGMMRGRFGRGRGMGWHMMQSVTPTP